MHPAYISVMIAWAICIPWIAFVIFANQKAHPKALFYLFFVEMWERFSYYGMRALLVLYMTEGFLKETYGGGEAYGIYGAYGALVYATPLIGGLLSEKFMGYRKAITWGAILMMIGHFLMALEHEFIFLTALAMLIMGNGFFKPNISSLVGKFYAKKDPKRDGAFTIFYMGINIGAFLSGFTCGAIGEVAGWHYGFSIAGFGMLIGLIIFYFAQKNGVLEDKGYAPHEVKEIEQEAIPVDERIEKFERVDNPQVPKFAGIPVNILIYILSIAFVPIIWFLIKGNDVLDYILLVTIAVMYVYLLVQSFSYEKVQRQRIWVILTLFLSAIIFWTFFELAGSALTVFTKNNVMPNEYITVSMFQSANPLFIMIFAPIFSWMWLKLSKMDKEPAAPIKFGIGLILLGLGFLVLNLGEGYAEAGLIPAAFMLMLYLLHTLGELTLSPVGLSLVTKLGPVKIVGFVMGFWMMASSAAHMAGKTIAQMTTVDMTVLLEDEERSDRFAANLTNPEVKKVFYDNKEFYKLYISDLSKKALAENPDLKPEYERLREMIRDTTWVEQYRGEHQVSAFLTTPLFLEAVNKGKAEPDYFVARVIDADMKKLADNSTNEVYKKKTLNEAVSQFLTREANLAYFTADTNFAVAQIDSTLEIPTTSVQAKYQTGDRVIIPRVSETATVVAVQIDTVLIGAKVLKDKAVVDGTTRIVDKKNTKPQVLTPDEIAKAIKASPTVAVSTGISKDTLIICLDLFTVLGFVAIGAGLLLISTAFFITRWMHGIK